MIYLFVSQQKKKNFTKLKKVNTIKNILLKVKKKVLIILPVHSDASKYAMHYKNRCSANINLILFSVIHIYFQQYFFKLNIQCHERFIWSINSPDCILIWLWSVYGSAGQYIFHIWTWIIQIKLCLYFNCRSLYFTITLTRTIVALHGCLHNYWNSIHKDLQRLFTLLSYIH